MIILDTHAWIWWIDESPTLPEATRQLIDRADYVGIPAICCWELAMLVAKHRIGLSMDVAVWIKLAFQRPSVGLLPLTPEIAVLSTRLPGEFHGDPADRLIVASSLTHNALLVTRDEKITDWGMVPVYWR
ncbi:MAG: type II toxin-antitoxin system VapC family toxin [Lamprobacter sp.]|uniref:type II toxin-antitoxin system VapC family toxin n=1 Tax=Lamprobacter sp. TaxID=3100796 RepID=UPI002B264362|nr:type II toxin-antitoxin system VapC family toxin [Lamprobacter sp.]MEA3643255.1 type II toxin-antitoxin system VapC family toxin [Lamprobacter sp.]